MTAFIHDAVRTARGKARADGGLARLAPHELVRQLITGLHGRTGQATEHVDCLVLGCVGQVDSQGGHIALVAKLHAGLPHSTAALTLNNYCVSGLSAIGQAASMVSSGQANTVLAGGVEMMSQVGFMADRAHYYTDASFPENTRYLPVALAADRLAANEGIERAALDAAALGSQRRAHAAQNQPALQHSRLAMLLADGGVALAHDECVRAQTNAENLAAMPPAFGDLAEHYAAALGASSFGASSFPPIHTIAHSPPVCDGAGLALVTGEILVDKRPRARIIAYAEAGDDPAQSLLAGLVAMKKVLASSGMTLAQMDRVEFMESFGVTLVKFLRDYPVDPARVNVSGGHMAKGHPLGASGAILVSTLLDCLDDGDGTFGLVVCTGASGVGAAMIVERLN